MWVSVAAQRNENLRTNLPRKTTRDRARVPRLGFRSQKEQACMSRSVSVRVPATVGNFGGAANCGAVALESSLNLKVTLREDAHLGIRYFGEDGERVPRDGSNLVVRAMESAIATKAVAFPGADFEIYSSVPVGVGFGSSAAATLAG